MKVFISWSGPRSKAVAQALKEWLPDVLQEVVAWMSEHDIDAGTRWSHKLSEILAESQLGIVCLTPENQKAPWIVYEAGALSKSVQQARLIPYLVAMSPSDLEAPLSQFQSVRADVSGTYKLLESINASSAAPLTPDRIRRLFERWWPDLEARIATAISVAEPKAKLPSRSDRDILNEILELVRSTSQGRDEPERVRALPFSVLSFQIDSRPLVGAKGEVFKIQVSVDTNVSRFLDTVWFRLNRLGSVPAYTYGSVWLLRNNRTDQIFDTIGRAYCRSRGEEEDITPVGMLDIREGDTLLAIPCTEST